MKDRPAVPDKFPDGYDRLAFNDGYNHALALIEECEAEIGRLRAIVRVNGLRWGHTHAEIDAILNQQQRGKE